MKKMEKKTAAILVLALAAAVAVTAGGAYALGAQAGPSGSPYYGHGMMSGWGGYPGGMMGGASGRYGMFQYMQQRAWGWLNYTSAP